MIVEDHASTLRQPPEFSEKKVVPSARQRTHLCCEVRLKDGCALQPLEVRQLVHAWLMSSSFAVTLGKHDPQQMANPLLRETCAEINIEPVDPGDYGYSSSSRPSPVSLPPGVQRSPLHVSPVVLALVDVSVQVVAYRLHREVVKAEVVGNNEEEVGIPSYQRWTLPHENLHGLWDTLHFDSGTKRKLLQYATTAMLFSDRQIDSKALAHKLSVRLSGRYSTGQLVEINAHSLFSRWFSESGKLVVKLFTTVKRMLDNSRCFVCLLVDEVESLSAARSVASSGNDPSDALRVVNVLLTQLDTLRFYPNALVLTTSNLTEKIDPAFLDRADLKQYIPNPSRQCRYDILRECLMELMKSDLLKPPVALYPFEVAVHFAENCQSDLTVAAGRRLLPRIFWTDAAEAALSSLRAICGASKWCTNFCMASSFVERTYYEIRNQLQTAYCKQDAPDPSTEPSPLEYLEHLLAAAQAETVGQTFAVSPGQLRDRSKGSNQCVA